MGRVINGSIFLGVFFVFLIAADVTSAQNCRPNANQIAIFADWRYEGKCKLLDIAGYATPQAMEFENDSISSILVGANVQTDLCGDDLYQGVCQTFFDEIDFLGNTSVGNDTVSSIRIMRRGARGSGGTTDLRDRLAGTWIRGQDKLVFDRDKFAAYNGRKMDFSAPYDVVDDSTISYKNLEGAERRRVFTFSKNNTVLTSTNPATNESFNYKRSGTITKSVTKKKR